MSIRPLFLGAYPIGYPNATGQTLAALYGSDLGDSVISLVGHNEQSVVGTTVALPEDVLRIEKWVRSIVKATDLQGRSSRASDVAAGMNDSVRDHNLGFVRRVRRDARVALDIMPAHLPKRTLEFLRAERPDVIHSLLGNGRMMRIAIELSDKINIPIVPHFMDDWPSTLYSSGELGGRARATILSLLAEVIVRAPVLLTIGRAMASEFAERYGRPTLVAANGVFPPERDASNLPVTYFPRNLVYSGGLHLGRDRILLAVARELARQGSSWSLVVHTTQPVPSEFRDAALSHHLSFCTPLSPSEVHGVLSRAGALLFVESLEPAIAAYTHLSVSTKVAEYVASGRPIIAIGPAGQASMVELARYAKHVRSLNELEGMELSVILSELDVPEPSQNIDLSSELTIDRMRQNLLRGLQFAAQSGDRVRNA